MIRRTTCLSDTDWQNLHGNDLYITMLRHKVRVESSKDSVLDIVDYIKEVPEDKRAPVLVFSGKDLTDVQEDLLKERVVGLVKKDDVSMENLSKMIQGIVTK